MGLWACLLQVGVALHPAAVRYAGKLVLQGLPRGALPELNFSVVVLALRF